MISIELALDPVNTKMFLRPDGHASFVAVYQREVAKWTGNCSCGRPYRRHGSYTRKTPFAKPIRIQRVYCPACRVSHALLPCIVVGYSQSFAEIKEAAVKGIVYCNLPIETLSERLGIEPKTIARWWHQFRQRIDVLLDVLSRLLADSAGLSSWASGRLRTPIDQARKIFELVGRCRATFSRHFAFSDFPWLNLLNPYLLIARQTSR